MNPWPAPSVQIQKAALAGLDAARKATRSKALPLKKEAAQPSGPHVCAGQAGQGYWKSGRCRDKLRKRVKRHPP